jgi:hypothetical protein
MCGMMLAILPVRQMLVATKYPPTHRGHEDRDRGGTAAPPAARTCAAQIRLSGLFSCNANQRMRIDRTDQPDTTSPGAHGLESPISFLSRS